MSKLSAVVQHEFRSVVRQVSFWVMLIATPLFVATIFIIVGFGSSASQAKVEELTEKLQNVAVVDESGFIIPDVVTQAGQRLEPVSQLDALREEVRAGELTGLIYYPANLQQTKSYQIFVDGTDYSTITALTGFAGQLLNISIFAPIGSAEVIALANGQANAEVVTYENGEQSPGFNKYIVPGAIAAIFFLILFFAVSYALTSIGEEKENRSMEMLLTHVKPRTAIVGKLLGVILITLVQILFFIIIALIGYFVAVAFGMSAIQLPAGVSLANLVFDPVAIFFGLGFLVAGFALYAGLMAVLAVVLPYKLASGWSSLFFVGGFSPFWFLSLIMTDPTNPVVTFATFFPLTSPTTSLIRNMLGNLNGLEAVLALLVMATFATLAIGLAVRLFPKGALEFNNALSLKDIFGK